MALKAAIRTHSQPQQLKISWVTSLSVCLPFSFSFASHTPCVNWRVILGSRLDQNQDNVIGLPCPGSSSINNCCLLKYCTHFKEVHDWEASTLEYDNLIGRFHHFWYKNDYKNFLYSESFLLENAARFFRNQNLMDRRSANLKAFCPWPPMAPSLHVLGFRVPYGLSPKLMCYS